MTKVEELKNKLKEIAGTTISIPTKVLLENDDAFKNLFYNRFLETNIKNEKSITKICFYTNAITYTVLSEENHDYLKFYCCYEYNSMTANDFVASYMFDLLIFFKQYHNEAQQEEEKDDN